MSFSSGNFALGGPASPMRFAQGQTRGRIQGGGMNGVNYPSPFFDVAHTYLPTTVKQLFKYCRYYFLTNPLINAIIMKMSEYPVTDIVVDHADPEVVRKWTDYLHDTVRIRSFQVECGLDYNTYGTCPVSMSFPFQKYLTCRGCGFSEQAKKIRNRWIYTSGEFRLTCPRCGNTGAATPKDWYYRDASSIRPIRWNVEDIEVSYNDITGECTYFFTIPANLRADITLGKKDAVEGMPQIFLQAIRQEKGVVFSKQNFFALKRATLAWQDRGWGTPMILPVLKDAFYLQIMKKAQECVAPGTLIETSRGLVPASDVNVGELVLSHTGEMHPVTAREVRPMVPERGDYAVEITLAGLPGIPSTFSDNHPMWVWHKDALGGWDWDDAGAVKANSYIGYPIKPSCAPSKLLSEITSAVISGGFNSAHIRAAEQLSLVRQDKQDAYRLWQLALELGCTSVVSSELSIVPGSGRIYRWTVSGGSALRLVQLMDGDGANVVDGDDTGYFMGDYFAARVQSTKIVECPEVISFEVEGEHTFCTPGMATHNSLLLEHIVPLRVIFPQAASGTSDPFSSVSLVDWRDQMAMEIARWRHDCVSPSTLVEVPGSVTCAGNIRVGDSVRNAAGGFSSVERVWRRPLRNGEKAYRVIVRGINGVNVTVSEGHPFLAAKSLNDNGPGHVFGDPQYLRVSSLKAGDYIGHPVDAVPYGKLAELAGTNKYESPTVIQACELYRRAVGRGENVELSIDENWKATVTAYTCNNSDNDNGALRDGVFWSRVRSVEEVECDEVIGFQTSHEEAVRVEGDSTAHGTFCLVGMACANSNYIPIMPLPIGNQSIGGDGKALLLGGEMQQIGEQIIMGMGVTRDFLEGGAQYSGSNVSMRMLENAFLSYIGRHRQMVNWMVDMVAHFMGWPKVNVRFKPFKMADDLQRKSYLFQLNGAQKISDTTLLADSDLDIEEENDIMMRESARRLEATKKSQLAMAAIQGESQVIMMKMQAKAQQAMQQATTQPPAVGEPGVYAQAVGQGGEDPGLPGGQPPTQLQTAPDGQVMSSSVPSGAESPLNAKQDLGAQPGSEKMPVDLVQLAEGYAAQMLALPKDQQEMAMGAIEAQSPELYQLVMEFMTLMQQGSAGQALAPGGSTATKETGGIDTRPLPEIAPPRREAALV